MIFSSICVQINTMFTKKEFKVAAVIALFYSCFAFAFTLTEFSGIDISKIKDANQLVCFSQSNRLWFFFSLLYPFLLVLPFSTSYIDDYKNQLLPVYISRTSRTIVKNVFFFVIIYFHFCRNAGHFNLYLRNVVYVSRVNGSVHHIHCVIS